MSNDQIEVHAPSKHRAPRRAPIDPALNFGVREVHVGPQDVMTVYMDHDIPTESRAYIAGLVAALMYGNAIKVPDCAPYTEYLDHSYWVLDDHNDWYLQFDWQYPREFTVRHRKPEDRHLLILGALKINLELFRPRQLENAQ